VRRDFVLAARELGPEDVEAFRAIRLEALRTEGELFGPTYEREVALSYEEWTRRVTPTVDTRVFGLFRQRELVGIMRAMPWDEDPMGCTALWGAAYVKPKYRGQGLAMPLYAAREKWTRDHPEYTSAVLFIRQDNKRSQELHLKHGAKLMCERIMNWPDREPAAWNFYRVDFRKAEALAA
jgi:GNAT superfamily N-acetyltransferase